MINKIDKNAVRQKRHQRVRRPHGRQRVAPQRLPDDQRVGDVIQLLQQISRDHRQRKQQQPPDDASLRQIPIHVLPFQFPM